MKAWAPAAAESRTPRLGTGIGVLENFFHWFAEVGILATGNHFVRPRHSESQFTADQRDKGGPEEAVTVASPVESALGNSTTTKSVTVPKTAEVKADLDALIALDQEEIQRRRNLVRALFNDFWSDTHDKPATFVERLDQAEDYVNERLAAGGEFWRLDANTRAILGLPPRLRSKATKIARKNLGCAD
jgi:hypothetical protein